MNELPIAIMLVDDHGIVRKGLETLLEADGRFHVVAEAGSVAEAVERARSARPDIVLMDVRLPDGSGIEACRQIRAERPETRVVMLTSYPDEEAVMASVLAGAAGYLLKELNEDALLGSLRVVAQGGSLLSPELVGRMLAEVRRQSDVERRGEPDALDHLAPVDREILALIAEGKTNREIGEALKMSENTVKAHVSRLLEKLGFSRRSEAAAFMARQRERSRSD